MLRLLLSLILALLPQGATQTAIVNSKAASGGSTPATYVSSTQCITNGTLTTCSNTGLSIPSGDLIVMAISSPNSNPFSVTDSNADTFHCTSTYTESGSNLNQILLCVFKATTTITSATCTETFGSNVMTCMTLWYTAGSLGGTIDKSTGQDQPATTNWTTGSTSTLSGTNDLVVGIWGILQSPGSTTTSWTDGSTQRITCMTGSLTTCGVADRNVTVTTAVAATGTNSVVGYQVVAVMAVQ